MILGFLPEKKKSKTCFSGMERFLQSYIDLGKERLQELLVVGCEIESGLRVAARECAVL